MFVSAKLKQLVEISPQFDAISTAMADFTAPNKPQRRNPKIKEDNIRCTSAPFCSDTTFKMTYKEWPVMPPEHPVWAKKPVYKRRSGGFVTKSLYAVCIHVKGVKKVRFALYHMI